MQTFGCNFWMQIIEWKHLFYEHCSFVTKKKHDSKVRQCELVLMLKYSEFSLADSGPVSFRTQWFREKNTFVLQSNPVVQTNLFQLSLINIFVLLANQLVWSCNISLIKRDMRWLPTSESTWNIYYIKYFPFQFFLSIAAGKKNGCEFILLSISYYFLISII